MSRNFRILIIGLVVLLITAPIAFFLFALGLVVHEAIIRPTAALATAATAAIVASWTADGLIRDGSRTLINQVTRWTLIWALIPAGLVLVTAFVGSWPPGVWIAFTVVYTSTAGVILALRHRSDDLAQTRRGVATAIWLAGTAVAVSVVIFIASLFGLTGA